MTTIRRARLPADLPALEGLFDLVHTSDGHRPIGEHQYLELASGPHLDVVGMIIDQDDRPIAFAGLTPGFEPGWWTLELAVHPACRSGDFFTQLLEQAVTEVSLLGGNAVRLWAFLPRLVDAALAHGFRSERELRMLRRALPYEREPEYPTGLTVDRFRPGMDEQVWLEVNNAAFAGHPENGNWSPQILTYRMAQPWFDPKDLITAYLDGRLVGFCWVKRETPTEGEIYVVAVAPEKQGVGLGRALVEDALGHMGRQGAVSAVLYVDSNNHRALGLYDALGFHLDHVDRSFVRALTAN